ncbi:MAG: hypothetical protein H6Q52_3217 [Deltaproteobacteria bacterium]|nr:hypothetical protein [Deltaproteobacteria bacterium]
MKIWTIHDNVSAMQNAISRTGMEAFENIEKRFCTFRRQRGYLMNKLKMLQNPFKSPAFSRSCIILLSCFILVSCSYMKNIAGKPQPVMENSLIAMNEDQVRKKLGEPTMVSLTSDNKILWTYRPEWKIMPDNKNTVYIEFDQGTVTKVIKADK